MRQLVATLLRRAASGSACGLLGAALLTTACGDNTPSTPTPPINLTGIWDGSVTVLGTTARMTWTVTQTNTAVTGPVLLALTSGTVLLNGTLNGTLSGSTLTYTITVGSGGIPAQPSCSGQIGGTMNASIGVTSTMTGTSAITSSTCAAPPLPGGNLTLIRR